MSYYIIGIIIFFIIFKSIIKNTKRKNKTNLNKKINYDFKIEEDFKIQEKEDIKVELFNNKEEKKQESKESRKEWYQEYLKSNHWKETREKALKRSGYKCQVCGYDKNLQVHHNTYKNIGHEDPTDLVVLCWKCHKTFHGK